MKTVFVPRVVLLTAFVTLILLAASSCARSHYQPCDAYGSTNQTTDGKSI